MIIFILIFAAVSVLFHRFVMKSVNEYSYYGNVDTTKNVDYWYYQARIEEKQNA
jgi:hypothetical protein